MQTKILHIQPRQTGKTTQAISKFLENPTQTLFVTTNLTNVKIICDKLGGKYLDNVISQKQLIRKLEYINKYKLIIFDEYLFHKYDTNDYLKIRSNNSDILMYSSVNKSYDKRILLYVKKYKSPYENMEVVYKDFLKEFGQNYVKDFEELYNNFLTDFDTNIVIRHIEEFSHISQDRLNEIERNIGQNSFEKEYLNKFLK